MKAGTAFVTALFTLASFPLVAQQPPPANQETPSTQVASPEASAVMSPVNGELVSKLDSKTAKSGDSVVVQTKMSAKTTDGTEIPKGSKLVGHVIAAHASQAGDNSQVAVEFDHLELKGGQSVPVHSQIQSITPAGGAASNSGSAMSAPAAGGSSNPSASGANGSRTSDTAQSTSNNTGAGNGGPTAGTVVARTGNIAIQTTSVPGVLLANNAPGQQDPRMAQTSSVLLGAKQDIQLDSGTQMVVGVSAGAAGGTQ
jgi:hypothetical protein